MNIRKDKDNIKTDNIPLLDELIFNIKKISQTCVLKEEETADKFETLNSQKSSDLYIACLDNRVTFNTFTFNHKELLDVGIPDYIIDECLKDKEKIPHIFRKKLVENKREFIIDTYIEYNDYYRMLNGSPKIGDKGLKVEAWRIPPEIVNVDINKYLHEMTDSEIDILYTFGIIDAIYKENPTKKYLNYMGSKRISIYNARTSVNFQLLYVVPDMPSQILTRFKEKIEMNRVYTLKTIYSDAFKIGSDYYDNFIRSFILIQTFIDMITELPDMIIKREIFDIRMIELILTSNGIDFFPEIPYRYQLAMVRNINRLIKYKSTTKNIVDICSLFGFDNIRVFKYFLLKDRKVDEYGKYIFATMDYTDPVTGEVHNIEDVDKTTDLRFVKVPIDEVADDYITDRSKYLDYDEIVEGDKYWNGDLEHKFVKTSIMHKQFNYLQSKYLSVDTLYSLTELSFQLSYFHNMLFDDVKLEDKLLIKVPAISGLGTFRFTDIFSYLYALMYEYNGIADKIMDTSSKVMSVKGFNFRVNFEALSNYIREKGFTMEELGVADFQIPKSDILTYNQLMNIFTKNKNIHDHIIKQLRTADNKKIYDIYKKLYDSLLIMEHNLEFFKMSNGKIAKSYTEFLLDRDPILYNSIIEIRKLDSREVIQEKISNIIDATIYEIEQYIELDDFKFIFNNLPAVSAESVKKYVYKVINFFKSYKVDIMSINTIYVFDDKLENKIKMIDEVFMQYFFHKYSPIETISKLTKEVSINNLDSMNIIDQLYISTTSWVDKYYNEVDKIKDNTILTSVKNVEDQHFIMDTLNMSYIID